MEQEIAYIRMLCVIQKSPYMKNKLFILTVLVFLIGLAQVQAQQVIRLYSGIAPGSENWTWKEQNLGGYLRDVTDPTLTAFVPSNPNGIAVIIAPGGGFHYLVYELEGTAVAKKLNEKGITAFVLKYRLVHEDPVHPYYNKMMETKNFNMLDSVSMPVMMTNSVLPPTVFKSIPSGSRLVNLLSCTYTNEEGMDL